ncbi:DUF2357 domain-containing protein [Polaribacter sp. Hel_I_88]|uniref:DUF2357 domain-containing protein n=1 Tax=Polaribacter sp. Hel_I_88 TaxID=1250006 RepID=UPI00047B2451|nr:DUF2357 domain-containing protein [Polaribacter sp. Hel_I_88]
MINNQTKKYSYAVKNHGTFDIITSENERLQDFKTVTKNFELRILGQKQSVNNSEKVYVFDWQEVTFNAIIDPLNHAKEYSLWLDNKLVAHSKTLNKQLHSIRTLKTKLSFTEEIGCHVIKILSPNDKVVLELTFEVFPENIQYKQEYKLLQQDCVRIVNNLSFKLLTSYYKKIKNKSSGTTSNTKWWFVLDALFEDLIKSLELIQRNPKHTIITDEEVKQIDKVRKPSSKNKIWLTKNTQYISNNKDEGIELISGHYFSHALTLKKKISYDNYENRFVKYMANQIISRLTDLKKDLHKNSVSDNENIVQKIKTYTSRLHGFLNKIPFSKVGDFEKETYFSSTLTKAAGYKDLLQIYSLLENGFEILEDDFSYVDYKKIDNLYGYWCFIKMFDIIQNSLNFTITNQNILGLHNGKFKANVGVNDLTTIKLASKEHKEISLEYNKEKSLITMELITKKENLSLFQFYPNYQITNNNKYSENSNYTDSSLLLFKENIEQEEIKNEIKQNNPKDLKSIILYPSNAENTNFKKLKKEDTATKYFPLLPSTSGLLEKYIRNIIVDETTNNVQAIVGMQYQQYISERETFDKGILIGRLKKEALQKRLTYLENENRYYFPFVKSKNSRIYKVSYLLLTKPESSKALLKKVKRWEILSKKDLIDTGINWKLNSEHYLVFNLENKTEKIDTKIEIPIFSFRYTTLRGLYFFKNQLENNALYIANETSYLLYKFLIKKNIEFTISWSKDEKYFTNVVFKLSNNLKLICSNRFPYQHYMVKNKIKPLSSLIDQFH